MAKSDRKEKWSCSEGTAKFRESSSNKDASMFKLPEGASLIGKFPNKKGYVNIDIIPYTVGEGNPNARPGATHWERTFWIHKDIGKNRDWVVCPRNFGKECPICQHVKDLQQKASTSDALLKRFKSSKRIIVNMIDMDAEREERGKVKVWHTAFFYFGDAIKRALGREYEGERENMDGFCTPKSGFYLRCSSIPGYNKGDYKIDDLDFRKRDGDLTNKILDQAICLDDILVVKSKKELEVMLDETGLEEDEEDLPEDRRTRDADEGERDFDRFEDKRDRDRGSRSSRDDDRDSDRRESRSSRYEDDDRDSDRRESRKHDDDREDDRRESRSSRHEDDDRDKDDDRDRDSRSSRRDDRDEDRDSDRRESRSSRRDEDEDSKWNGPSDEEPEPEDDADRGHKTSKSDRHVKDDDVEEESSRGKRSREEERSSSRSGRRR